MFTDSLPTQADPASEVYLIEALPSLLTRGQPFTHPLGEDVNAERHVKAPEWFDRREPKPQEEIFEEKYSSIDRQMEQKLKAEEEKEESLPEWAEQPALPLAPVPQAPVKAATPPLPETLSPPELPKLSELPKTSELPKASDPPKASEPPKAHEPPKASESLKASEPPKELRTVAKFSCRLLQDQVNKGDPFAKCISANSRKDDQFAYVEEGSEPEERVWFYRDPKSQVQGPFSWVDMYHWNLVGYFPVTLPVALQKPEGFAPLEELFILSREIKPQEPEFSLFAYHPDKSRKQPSPPKPTATVWGPKERPPASSLADIQREEREGVRKG
jgi:hypothetical protein